MVDIGTRTFCQHRLLPDECRTIHYRTSVGTWRATSGKHSRSTRHITPCNNQTGHATSLHSPGIRMVVPQTWHATSLHSSGIRTVVINKNGDLRSEASILNYYHSGWRFFNNSILCICSE
ncbi:MAG: hypothetical protein HDS84_08220 [Bacteroidales bacterium]|nr:hypothetical protein [Bacteroidales bacterium]